MTTGQAPEPLPFALSAKETGQKSEQTQSSCGFQDFILTKFYHLGHAQFAQQASVGAGAAGDPENQDISDFFTSG